MSLPKLGIFADTRAQAAYLEEIARLAGWEASADNASAVLLSGECECPADVTEASFFRLGSKQASDPENVRVVTAPLKAGNLIDILVRVRLASQSGPAQVPIGPAILDTRENLWILEGQAPLRLTDKETAILIYLKEAEGMPVSRQTLLDAVWAYAQGVETHTLETHIYRLRQKIESDPAKPEILLTDGAGYKIPV
ncbi:MAG: hypothetical protein DI551_05440 [Micavibrio aeruginosavorus]|uniref:OmpR/PhoB-type domain-containing protein n=1 Tax=Micavibrio aeruginosavorus TaxID=349221 RepID=A0A2W5N0V3_9BACT|nr:MAG: hypothetical protein DI551_05440 [Micavibrio aeruginosavorus]